jgi:hypothetical protein
MKKIDSAAQTMATSYTLARPLDAYTKRLRRVQKTAAEDVYYRLKNRQHTSGPVYATQEWEDSMKARNIRAGVEEFKRRHPRYGTELDKIIKKQREVRRNYVSFEFEQLPEEFYYSVLRDVGIPKETAEQTLQAIMNMANHLAELKQPVKILME